MIWRVLNKDWKLMWKATLAVAALQLLFAFIQFKSELGRGNPVIQQFGTLLMMLWPIASVILIVMLVQQDAIPGTRQDWLTRPIRRGDVVIAKIVYAAITVQGATLAGDIIHGLASGFPLKQTLGAALSRAAIGFVAITLPALALGALTQSIAEAMVMSVVLIGGAFLFIVMATALAGDTHQFDPTNMTGVEWIPNLIRYATILATVLVLLTWQYQTRRTLQGRLAAAAIMVAVLCSQVIPWTPVFAVEKSFSPRPGAAVGISIAWRDANPRIPSDTRINRTVPAQNAGQDGSHVVLPLFIEGLGKDAVLKEDKSEVDFLDASGRLLYQGNADDIEIRHEDGVSGPDQFMQSMKIPAGFIQEHRNTPIQISTTYSMTLFALRRGYTLKAENDDQMLEGWGRCRTRVDGTYSAIQMMCLQMGKGPTCATVFLEDPHDGSRNPVNTACYPNYSPYLERPIPDATTGFRLILPYRDPAGFIRYPVDASKLPESQIRIRTYEPIDHITRVVRSPLLPMKELVK